MIKIVKIKGKMRNFSFFIISFSLLMVSPLSADFLRDNTKEIVLDTTTNLIWQDNSESQTISKMWVTQANYDAGDYNNTSGDTAIMYCENLNFASYEDWRLPNIKELLSISDKRKTYPSIGDLFQNTSSNDYWSSSTYADDSGYAWAIDFGSGNSGNDAKGNSIYVRCVRDGQ